MNIAYSVGKGRACFIREMGVIENNRKINRKVRYKDEL